MYRVTVTLQGILKCNDVTVTLPFFYQVTSNGNANQFHVTMPICVCVCVCVCVGKKKKEIGEKLINYWESCDNNNTIFWQGMKDREEGIERLTDKN